MTNNKIKFPYAISDFYKLITGNYFYIDRTDYIPLLEEAGTYPLFLRPRRFGKSLLLSMLKNYYDVNKADEFERLFGHLAIGQQPTPLHNQYFILKFDFSMVAPHGNAQEIQQSLYDHINETVYAFGLYYQNLLKTPLNINPNSALASIQSVFSAVKQTPYKLYILIDEYDNFANEVLMSIQQDSKNRYQALVHGEGCLKSVLKVIKGGTEGLGVDRVFITGVSPIAMSDVTSGFNIAEDIYLNPRFNNLCGFTEEEIKKTLQQVVIECNFPSAEMEKALDIMRSFYDGYAFTYNAKPDIYNPTLALHFLKYFYNFCEYPPNMLDQNLSTDRNKLQYVSNLPHGEEIISQALDEKQPLGVFQLAHRFGVKDMHTSAKDAPFMASLLYFLGMLTMGGRDQRGKNILQIPNLVARRLYLERLQDLILSSNHRWEATNVAGEFYSTGDMESICRFIERTYFSVFDNRDYAWANELSIKTIFLTLLFNDTQYIMDSETALKRSYADLTMIIRPDMRQYQLLDFLIEFKYIELSKLKMSGEVLREKTIPELMKLKRVKEAFKQSETQLKNYHATLQQAYNNTLRLRTFSVVALGYDRLLWKTLNTANKTNNKGQATNDKKNNP